MAASEGLGHAASGPRRVVGAGPFRFTEIHGPHRSVQEQGHAARLLRRCGLQLGRGKGPKAAGQPRLDRLVALYSQGHDVEPLVAMERGRVLSSGDKALIVIDGRHRTFAAADANVERLPVFVLTKADAVFSY